MERALAAGGSHFFSYARSQAGSRFSREWIESLTSCDTTELERTGDLAIPSEHVKEAYDLAADYFGAGETWFVTTGTTIAIRVMIASALFEETSLLCRAPCTWLPCTLSRSSV